MVRDPYSYGMPLRLLGCHLRNMLLQNVFRVVPGDYEKQVLNIVAAKAP